MSSLALTRLDDYNNIDDGTVKGDPNSRYGKRSGVFKCLFASCLPTFASHKKSLPTDPGSPAATTATAFSAADTPSTSPTNSSKRVQGSDLDEEDLYSESLMSLHSRDIASYDECTIDNATTNSYDFSLSAAGDVVNPGWNYQLTSSAKCVEKVYEWEDRYSGVDKLREEHEEEEEEEEERGLLFGNQVEPGWVEFEMAWCTNPSRHMPDIAPDVNPMSSSMMGISGLTLAKGESAKSIFTPPSTPSTYVLDKSLNSSSIHDDISFDDSPANSLLFLSQVDESDHEDNGNDNDSNNSDSDNDDDNDNDVNKKDEDVIHEEEEDVIHEEDEDDDDDDVGKNNKGHWNKQETPKTNCPNAVNDNDLQEEQQVNPANEQEPEQEQEHEHEHEHQKEEEEEDNEKGVATYTNIFYPLEIVREEKEREENCRKEGEEEEESITSNSCDERNEKGSGNGNGNYRHRSSSMASI